MQDLNGFNLPLGQGMALGLLLAVLLLFIWGRLRHDLVALIGLLAAVVLGLVPAQTAFSGLGHPAVITVALVLVLSQAIQESGLIDRVAAPLESLVDRPVVFLAAICLLAALLSGFMNNVGALALLMPLVIALAPRPSMMLMPLAFATILGGMTTLIGTPPNIIVSTVRADILGQGYNFFDFAPIGILLATTGVFFIVALGWRLIPKDRSGPTEDEPYSKHSFLAELRVGEESEWIGKRLNDIEQQSEEKLIFIGIRRHKTRLFFNVRHTVLRAGDVLIVRAVPEDLEDFLQTTDLTMDGSDSFEEEHLTSEDMGLMEVVVGQGSILDGRTPKQMRFRRNHSINLLGVSRQGADLLPRLANVRLRAGDVLLIQGAKDALRETMVGLGCLPIASKAISIRRKTLNLWPAGLFAAAIGVAALGWLPIYITFALALGAIVIFDHLPKERLYTSIDWPVIVLLAAMIPLGNALITTGATETISALMVDFTQGLPAWAILLIIMLVTMTLSDLMNNAATAVVMAPLAAQVADALGYQPDAFMMAVALGASCAFMTPIGHQNNLLVMGPGGYRFGDYWRMGLPLQLIILALGIPALMWVWPI